MGHFGSSPIRRAWLLVVFPACILNYMGQGALILGNPSNTSSPFFLLAPGWARIPMVFLAAVATVIASQAVITGAFSVAHQAARLGYLPPAAHRIHLGTDDRPDLHPVHQLAATGGGDHARGHVPELGRAGLRLRHGRDRHDHHHDLAVLLLRPSSVALAAVDRADRRRRPARHRPAVLRLQPDQAGARSLASAADRHHHVHHPHHLAAGPRARHPAADPTTKGRSGRSSSSCTP